MAMHLFATVLLTFSATASAGLPAVVPAVDNWGLLGLTVLAGLAGIVALRKRRK